MILVIVVLVCSLFASLAGLLFGPLMIQGEGKELKKIRDLAESGIEVESRLVGLERIGDGGYLHGMFEFGTLNGDTVLHQTGEKVSPAMVVGSAYPLVYHPDNVKHVLVGTMATVRKEVRFRRDGVRGAKKMMLLAFAVGVLAVVGLILSPA
ncbi:MULTISPECIES: hypothetical protein [Streptomyces]|uniref:Uncharacterized protein n=1 Tax=Streptomyces solicathayae TaxID=3081768 RepID=A0ABZ0LY65_9ACTN|nr:hypothetical protein [Streptomyces sp. HUAS YS2]WOX24472.1 hypothetical protein R2D22_25055 [Streptomyces sp. HUAS YS2]